MNLQLLSPSLEFQPLLQKSSAWVVVVLVMLFWVPNSANAQVKESCACEQNACGPCQKPVVVGTKVKFCDWGDINVCRDVVCENVPYYFSCLANLEEKKKSEEESKKENKLLSLDYEEDGLRTRLVSEKQKDRAPASQGEGTKSARPRSFLTPGRKEVPLDLQVEKESEPIPVGRIEQVSALLEVVRRGQPVKLKKGESLFVGDEVLNTTKSGQSLQLSFAKGKVHMALHEKSRVIIEDPMSILGRFQPFAYLVHGGVDLQVDFQEGSFDLLAGQILARTQGGRARVSYQMEERGLTVRVESLTARLDVLKARDLSGVSVPIAPGQFLSWVSETPRSMFSLDEKLALAHEGFLSPVFAMSPLRKKELGILPVQEAPLFADWTEKKSPTAKGRSANRQLASKLDDFCQAPAGQFQQCAWACEGNPKGAKSCQASQANVHCVRRECNAAGQWGHPTPFASSYGDLCPAQGVRVGSCSPSGD